MPHFTHDGHRIAYEIHGTGRPVVLLHGITVSFAGNFGASGWIQRLVAAGRQVIGIDFRGHGQSDKPRDISAYGTANLAADVVALLDHLAIERTALFGYSLGTIIALRLLHQFPGRFGPSVLMATGSGLMGVPPYTSDEVLPALAAALARPAYPADLPAHVAMYWTFAVKVGGDRLASHAAALGDYPPATPAELGKITVPVLVVSGEQDPVLGRGSRLASAIPFGEYLEIAGADHFDLGRNPQAQAEVTQFLARAAHDGFERVAGCS